MIPIGSTLIRLSDYKGKIIRIYRKGERLWIAESAKNRESVKDTWPMEALPERLQAWVLNELHSRETIVPLNTGGSFWAR